jgi:hypothetical protein
MRSGLQGCDGVQSGKHLQDGVTSQKSCNQYFECDRFLLNECYSFLEEHKVVLRRRRQKLPKKRCYLSMRQHGAISQKTIILIFTAMRTSKLTFNEKFWYIMRTDNTTIYIHISIKTNHKFVFSVSHFNFNHCMFRLEWVIFRCST